MDLFSLVFIGMRVLPFSGQLLQEVEVVALLAGCFRFGVHLVAVRAVQVAQVGVMRVDAVPLVGLGDDVIHVGVAFRAHGIAEVALERRIVEIIGDIPDGLLYLVLDAVLMAIDAVHAGGLVLLRQQLAAMIALDVGIHDVAGGAGNGREFLDLVHGQVGGDKEYDDDSCTQQWFPLDESHQAVQIIFHGASLPYTVLLLIPIVG